MNIEMLEEPVTALTVPARAAIALGSDKARTELAALVLKSKDVQAINSTAGRDEAHSFAMALVKARTTIGKISKEAREDATKFSKAVIEEEKALTAITEPEEKRLLALRDAWDAKVAAEKEAKAAAERARVTAIHERISGLREFVSLALECRTSERVQALIDKLATDPMEGFEEFDVEAKEVRKAAMERMEVIIDQKKTDEAERARIKAEQEAEAAKLAFERKLMEEERAAIQADLDAKAAKAKEQADAEATALAAERAEMQRQRDQIAAERLVLEDAQREAKEEADRAAYMAAITAPKEILAPVECAQEATETIAETTPTVSDDTLVLNGGMLSIPIGPHSPPVDELIEAVAVKFMVTMGTAAEWLTNAADEIANFE